MKRFLGFPVYHSRSMPILFKQTVSITLFTGISYFILSILLSYIMNGKPWGFIQTVEKHYFIQFALLLSGVSLGLLMRYLLNKILFEFFTFVPFYDRVLYPLGFIIAYLEIIEFF